MRYAAVIAAAGLSARMGDFKPMLCIGEQTMIESVITNLRSAGAEEIVVVVGYKADVLKRHLADWDVTFCENEDYATTRMFESYCMGIQALKKPYDALLLSPADAPLVLPETIRMMQDCGKPMSRPVCDGKVGHPVLLDHSVIPSILAFDGEGGLRGAMEATGPVEDILVNDKGSVMDADTPEDFRAIRRQQMEYKSGGRLWLDISVAISKNDIILTPQTAQFLEMIDHTGSLSHACATMHMSYSRGWKLINHMEEELGYPLTVRVSGGESGGGTHLTEKGMQLLKAYQFLQEDIGRMAQESFKKHFPEELH